MPSSSTSCGRSSTNRPGERKPVLLRKAAEDDLGAAIRGYEAEVGAGTALRFVACVEAGSTEIGRHPAMGSPRYAHELDLPGLRYWRLEQLPYPVFYREGEETVDVWCVLHAHRDIPASFGKAPAA
jgi:toxin ParE1/3/4